MCYNDNVSNPEKNHENDYPLPIVTLQTSEAALQDLIEKGQTNFLGSEFEYFSQENPVAAETVLSYIAGSAKTEQEELKAQKAVALLHELLRKQAAAEKLNKVLDS